MTFKPLVFFIGLLLLIASTSFAASPEFNGQDTFSFSRIDNQEHILGSYILTYTISDFLIHQYGMKPTKALIISTLTTITIGILKETLLDSQVSQSDLISDAIGTGAGAMTFYVIHF